MTVIAYDIETCPQPLGSLSPVQRAKLERGVEQWMAKRPDDDNTRAEAVIRATSPLLGRIVCISVVRSNGTFEAAGRPKSYADATDEAGLLSQFWSDLDKIPGSPQWVSFNGKKFDADWLKARSIKYGITPTQSGLLDTYPFKASPHADLMRAFDFPLSLADMCDLLGVDSPKEDMKGEDVAQAIEEDRLADVIRYCEADVLATLECYYKLKPIL